MHDHISLANKSVLVTGATAGIGRITALHLAFCGANIVACGRNAENGASLVKDIEKTGGNATFIQADVSSELAIANMLQQADEAYGGLDHAFNNAGEYITEDAFHQQADDQWFEVINVCLTGVYRCMKHQLQVMLANNDGRHRAIINNASTVGMRASSMSGPAYTAAKHGVIGLTRQAAIDYVSHGIRVNAICPGPTARVAAAELVEADPERSSLVASLNPTGQLVPAEQVAATVAFLCSEAASMINGQTLVLDGGQLAKM